VNAEKWKFVRIREKTWGKLQSALARLELAVEKGKEEWLKIKMSNHGTPRVPSVDIVLQLLLERSEAERDRKKKSAQKAKAKRKEQHPNAEKEA